ncbi:FAD/NAD(P)-binding domain-containing protein [Microthyrium microscopicum]|uniref:FAD/NAD(P)-binding domain-containing protein n=1 Tax=Microthyrium microscopicum TaxID=703497 RepID=A0A6A6UNM9_9PEZI|nr:FAD/NAD(P)-binding domain-containing protein [Microthyrium microscopicum]
MSGLKVLVVGASIAGPTTAYWFAKAGAKVTVIERFSELRTGGQAIDIRTAGVSVMRKMTGMEAQVRAHSVQEEGISFVRADGRPYGTIRPSGNPDQQTLVSEYEIYRGNLSKVLFDLTKDDRNIKYVFGEQIVSIRQDSDKDGPVAVEFANGLKTSDFDLVVGCDGAGSRTRAMGFGCGVRDHIFPTRLWAAYFSIKEDLLKGSKIGQGFNAVGGRNISIGTDPEGFSRIMLMGTHPKEYPGTTPPFREASAKGDDALKKHLAKHYEGVGWKADAAMQQMMYSDDFYGSEIVQVKLPSLHNGRVVLVGDAGYAAGPTGGGTSLALAGAYILAGEVAKHPGDIEAGLQAYEENMRPLIKTFQKIPPIVTSFIAPQTAWGIWFRNHIFAFIAWTGLVEFVSKYLAAGFASSESFPIPEYRWPSENKREGDL